MPLRFIVTLGLLLLGGLYLLPQNTENVRLTLWKGRAYDLPLILVMLGFAFLGALGMGIWDLPSRITNAWRRSQHRRAERRIQEAETFYLAGQASIAKGDRRAAQRAFRRSLRRNPVHKQALLESGNLQRDLGHLDTAFDLHRRAIQAGSNDSRLIESLADDFAIAGRPDALRTLLERVRYSGGDESIPLTRIRDYYISAKAWEIAAEFQKRLIYRPGGASEPDRMLLAHLLYEAWWQLAQAGKPSDAEKRLNEPSASMAIASRRGWLWEMFITHPAGGIRRSVPGGKGTRKQGRLYSCRGSSQRSAMALRERIRFRPSGRPCEGGPAMILCVWLWPRPTCVLGQPTESVTVP